MSVSFNTHSLTAPAVYRPAFGQSGPSAGNNSGRFLASTTGRIDGKTIQENLGMVGASLVTSRNVLREGLSGIQGMFGGENENSTNMLNEMQQTVLQRLVDNAKSLGANGLVGVRYATTNITGNFAELMAYGTAVKWAGRKPGRQGTKNA